MFANSTRRGKKAARARITQMHMPCVRVCTCVHVLEGHEYGVVQLEAQHWNPEVSELLSFSFISIWRGKKGREI